MITVARMVLNRTRKGEGGVAKRKLLLSRGPRLRVFFAIFHGPWHG